MNFPLQFGDCNDPDFGDSWLYDDPPPCVAGGGQLTDPCAGDADRLTEAERLCEKIIDGM